MSGSGSPLRTDLHAPRRVTEARWPPAWLAVQVTITRALPSGPVRASALEDRPDLEPDRGSASPQPRRHGTSRLRGRRG
jgi:hypothetical protein